MNQPTQTKPLTIVYTFKVIEGIIYSDILAFATDDYNDIVKTIKSNYPTVQQIVYDAHGVSVILNLTHA